MNGGKERLVHAKVLHGHVIAMVSADCPDLADYFPAGRRSASERDDEVGASD